MGRNEQQSSPPSDAATLRHPRHLLILAAFAGSTRPFAIGAIGALTLSLA